MIITSIIIVLPIAAGMLLWDSLPDVMATHFGMSNEANGSSNKVFAVFGIPLFCLLMQWMAALITARDRRNRNVTSNVFSMVLWIIPIISLVSAAVIYPYNLGYKVNVSFIMEMFLGVLFVILGNYMPKIRQNYSIGIRIPGRCPVRRIGTGHIALPGIYGLQAEL